MRHHTLAQSLDPAHLGCHQASPVVAALAFPDSSPQPPARGDRGIAIRKDAAFAHSRILSRWDNWSSATIDHRFIDLLHVVSTSPVRPSSDSSFDSCCSKPGNTAASLTLLEVTQMARICKVCASIPMCSLRHWCRRSEPCFFSFPLTRPGA